MCKICEKICEEIEDTFGHRVDPKKLEELIESSPLPENKESLSHTKKKKDSDNFMDDLDKELDDILSL